MSASVSPVTRLDCGTPAGVRREAKAALVAAGFTPDELASTRYPVPLPQCWYDARGYLLSLGYDQFDAAGAVTDLRCDSGLIPHDGTPYYGGEDHNDDVRRHIAELPNAAIEAAKLATILQDRINNEEVAWPPGTSVQTGRRNSPSGWRTF